MAAQRHRPGTTDPAFARSGQRQSGGRRCRNARARIRKSIRSPGSVALHEDGRSKSENYAIDGRGQNRCLPRCEARDTIRPRPHPHQYNAQTGGRAPYWGVSRPQPARGHAAGPHVGLHAPWLRADGRRPRRRRMHKPLKIFGNSTDSRMAIGAPAWCRRASWHSRRRYPQG